MSNRMLWPQDWDFLLPQHRGPAADNSDPRLLQSLLLPLTLIWYRYLKIPPSPMSSAINTPNPSVTPP